MTTEVDELKPCPFCGKDELREYHADSVLNHCVACDWCEASAPFSFWNTRTIERLSPPLDGEGVIQADIDRAIEEADRIFVANSDVLCEADIHTIERNLAQAFAAHRRAALTPSSRAGRPVPDHASGPSEIVDFDNGEAGTR